MADNVNITEGSGKTIAGDEIAGAIHQRVKITIGADGSDDGDVSSANPIPVTGDITRVRNLVDGTLSLVTRVDRVHNLVDGTLSLVSAVTNVTNTVKVGAADGTFAVYFSPGTPAIRLADNSGNVAQVDTTYSDGESNNNNHLDVGSHLSHYNGTTWDRTRGGSGVSSAALRVVHATDVGSSMKLLDSANTEIGDVGRVRNVIDGTIRVGNITGSTLQVNVGTIAGTTAVYLHSTAGTLNVQIKPGAILTYAGHTAQIFTASGSTSGGTTSGVTLISPSANYNFKVFAYALQTTAIAANVWRFANGSGASQTEFWRPLIISSETTSTPKGANLAVPPPSYLFATGTSTTLVLHSDAGSLVHYSVSYIKESA